MNGEVKTYRLNEPMSWKDFKKMPDDIKVSYIKCIREKYQTYDKDIADMLGIDRGSFSVAMKKLGLSSGNAAYKVQQSQEQKDAFDAWAYGVKAGKEADAPICDSEVKEPEPVLIEKKRAIPKNGQMEFNGKTNEILETMAELFGEANVVIKLCFKLEESESV